VDINNKKAESNAKGKNTKDDFPTLSSIIKCYNCQGYEQVVANCPTSFKIAIIARVSIEALRLIALSPQKSLM